MAKKGDVKGDFNRKESLIIEMELKSQLNQMQRKNNKEQMSE